jgi:hypothetical protein
MKLVREIVRSPTLLVWCLYVLLTPFYIAPNGLPQPGDALIFLLVPVSLIGWNGRLHRTLSRSLRPLIWFIAWVFIVDYGWAAILWKWTNFKDYVAYPIFYSFNAMVFICALVTYQRFGDRFLRVTVATTFVTIVLQVVASFFFLGGDNFRASLFFNSPNQLGYYALLSACLIVITQRRLQYGLLTASIGVMGCAYLALLSASRASLGAIAILLFLLLFSNPRIIVVASLAVIALMTLGGPLSHAIDKFETRSELASSTKRGTFMEDRGYDRVWNHKEYLLFGAGEGDNRRFDNRAEPREIHSSLVGVLFCYGLIGAGLFFAFAVGVVRGANLRSAIMLLPPLAYTVAHQGLRFTMLWILLAVYITLKVPATVPRRKARAPTTDDAVVALPTPAAT